MVMSCAPASNIVENLSLIKPWTTYDEWWVRQSAFTALAAAAEDALLAPQILPILGEMLCHEDRPSARGNMTQRMSRLAKKHKPDSEAGKQISSIFNKAVAVTRIDSGFRDGAGGFYVKNDFMAGLSFDTGMVLALAKSLKNRLPEMRPGYLVELTSKLLELQGKLPEPEKAELVDLLYGDYRQEFLRRMNAGEDIQLDIISDLTQLKDRNAGWQLLVKEPPAEREWRYMTFDAMQHDALDPKEGRRFRNVTLPEGLTNWSKPDFDDKAWKKGKAPIGIGKWTGALDAYGPGDPNNTFTNRSGWGEGEFLVMRSEFTIDNLDYDLIRLRILAKQGCRIYLNGHQIGEFAWFGNTPAYQPKILEENERKHLKQGKNILAVYTALTYWEGLPPMRRGERDQTPVLGQMDLYMEGLNKASLLGTSDKK
jgi:hypothetical protein